MTRLIVDDTDDSIKYTGPWFAYEGSQFDDVGFLGKPFGGTLHGTSSNASLTFTFNGTDALFFGTHGYERGSTSIAPSLQCLALVSNNAYDNSYFFTHSGNNQLICSMYLEDGRHTLILNVIFPKNEEQNTNKSTFWFDSIEYAASPSVPIDNAFVEIFTSDPRLQYGPGWMIDTDPNEAFSYGNKTNQKDSTFTVEFIGNSISWYGYIHQNMSTAATTASYTIDEESPTIFAINASTSRNVSDPSVDFNVMFFQTPIFDNGSHKLTVIYNGDLEQHSTPLTLQYLVVQNGTAGLPPPVENFTVASSSTIASSSTTPGTTIPTSSLPKGRVYTGPVVGGIIGGMTLIIAVILIMLFFLRRRRRAAASNDMYSIDESLQEAPPPINPFIMTEDDIVGEKRTLTQTTSSTPMAVGIVHQTKKTRARGAHRSPELDGARSNRLGIPETPSLRSVSTPSSRRSLTPSNTVPEVIPSQDFHTASSYGSRIVLRDEDSGVRLSRTDGAEVVLLPPEYTLS